jgi:hypothetical protein
MDTYDIQPHHLGPNAVLQLASFVTLCEGYLGLLPFVELWRKLYYLKTQRNAAGPYACGSAVICVRGTLFPKLTLVESVKGWHRTFFYVKNVDPRRDYIRLPAFVNAPSSGINWTGDGPFVDVRAELARLRTLREGEGLVASDLVAAFIDRRVLPLQLRPHRICDMSGRRDPCRLSTIERTPSQVAKWVNAITNFKLKPGTWRFGKPPYSRNDPAPLVRPAVVTPLSRLILAGLPPTHTLC